MAARLDDALIEAIKKSNIPVVGVERSDCETSFIKTFIDAGISSVDNIESIIGQYSLIKVLQGNADTMGLRIVPRHSSLTIMGTTSRRFWI